MSVNTAHSANSILLQHGEYMLLHFNHVSMETAGNDNPIFQGPKKGRIFLTSHRIIFRNKKRKTRLQSFCVPFMAMFNLSLGQPLFRPNYIKGSVFAMPDGNFDGIVTFKFSFNNGGAILYGQVMMRAASRILQNTLNDRFMRYERMGTPPPPPYQHVQLQEAQQAAQEQQRQQQLQQQQQQEEQRQQELQQQQLQQQSCAQQLEKPPSYEDSLHDSLPSYEDTMHS